MTTSPSGLTGHQEEWTCTFQDGSQKVIPNEEIALKEIAPLVYRCRHLQRFGGIAPDDRRGDYWSEAGHAEPVRDLIEIASKT